MIDLSLLDGKILDAAREGNWTVVIPVASALALILGLGIVAWLKGRKIAAMLVWVLLSTALTASLVPVTWIEDSLALHTGAIIGILFGIVGMALGVGLIAAIRLARPPSWWAQRRYDNDTYADAIERHHWTRVKPR